jgi:DNA-binding transcriptional LysR family regulator
LSIQPNLPIDVLRSFVAIVDAGSMLKATQTVFLTQSALSLQIKRLEDLLQQPLFSREGRRLALTPSGDSFLVYARRLLALNDEAVQAIAGSTLQGPVRIGMVQDYAETLLSGVLASFARLHPEAPVHARVGGTLELLDLHERRGLDLVLGFIEPGSEAEVRRDAMTWIGDASLAQAEILPLAVLEKPCRFREAALAALDTAGQPYRIAIETPNLSTLRAGVDAGLGLTCRTQVFGSTPLPEGSTRLPDLPQVATGLWHTPDHAPAARLAALVLPVVTASREA